MYWNKERDGSEKWIKEFNQNIWCIEITFYPLSFCKRDNSTKTFDVLKFLYSVVCYCISFIQPKHLMYWNMLFFQAQLLLSLIQPKHLMYWNFFFTARKYPAFPDSTKTFDVLKFFFIFKLASYNKNSTKTFDVLKFKAKK